MDWTKTFRILKTLNWTILLILSSVSYVFMGNTFTAGVILGGFLIIANFNILQHTITKAFGADGVFGANKGAVVGKYYLRLAALGLLIYLLIRQRWVNPVGLAVGLSVVVFSIVTLGVHMVFSKSSGEVA
ncbi:MAG: ATP synthase subunit I [Deltaproteobacteria bacterium]|nr:ATP synthase subunit I [Deltaproteobacteria bacterium]